MNQKTILSLLAAGCLLIILLAVNLQRWHEESMIPNVSDFPMHSEIRKEVLR